MPRPSIKRVTVGRSPARVIRRNPREGSSLDDFLRGEGIYEEAATRAVKETIAWQLERAMEKLGLSKATLARRMGTSRAALDRLLDPRNGSVTLATLIRAGEALDLTLRVAFGESEAPPRRRTRPRRRRA